MDSREMEAEKQARDVVADYEAGCMGEYERSRAGLVQIIKRALLARDTALLEALEQVVKIGDEWPMTRGYRKEIWDKARAAIRLAKGNRS